MQVSFWACAVVGLLVFGLSTLSAQVHDRGSSPHYKDPRDQDDYEWRQYLQYVKAQHNYLEKAERDGDRNMIQYRYYRKPAPNPYPACCMPGSDSETRDWYMNGGPMRKTPGTVRDR